MNPYEEGTMTHDCDNPRRWYAIAPTGHPGSAWLLELCDDDQEAWAFRSEAALRGFLRDELLEVRRLPPVELYADGCWALTTCGCHAEEGPSL
jgi:hypothetical protein